VCFGELPDDSKLAFEHQNEATLDTWLGENGRKYCDVIVMTEHCQQWDDVIC
jgi:hypothetical protein